MSAQPTAARADHHGEEEFHEDIIYPGAIPFVIVHLVCLGAIWTGITLEAVVICIALYLIRMFAATAGYHRYFSHRSYKTSRVGQFFLALLCQSTAQRGVLWWAAIHRHHHRHSDTELDVHSPRHRGFIYSHVGWIFARKNSEPDYNTVSDLTRFPELVWLNKHQYLVPALLAVAVYLVAGLPGLIVGFFWSTVILFHCVFMINSLAHVHGNQRYLTGDDSRNNWWLALITLGEGWHNNHHAYQSSTRQGFRWHEIDLTYYVLRALAWSRLIWDLRAPPKELVENEIRLGRKVVDRVAHQLAHTFPVDRIAEEVREAWVQTPTFEELRGKAQKAGAEAAARLAAMHLPTVQLPDVPSVEELRERARQLYAHAPAVSLDEIAERARELLLHAVSIRIFEELEPSPAT